MCKDVSLFVVGPTTCCATSRSKWSCGLRLQSMHAARLCSSYSCNHDLSPVSIERNARYVRNVTYATNATYSTQEKTPLLPLRFNRCVSSVRCVRCVLSCVRCVRCVLCVRWKLCFTDQRTLYNSPSSLIDGMRQLGSVSIVRRFDKTIIRRSDSPTTLPKP